MIRLSMTALLVLCAFASALAAEPETILIQEKYEVGKVYAAKSDENVDATQDINMGGMAMKGNQSTFTKTEKRIEVLAVNDKGAITKARVSWPKQEETKTTQQPGQPPADPVTSEGELHGTVILYEFDSEANKWKSKVEKGDSTSDKVAEEAKKADPFNSPFIPGREVKLGETWEATEGALKNEFENEEFMKIAEIKGTCKADSWVKEGDTRLLKVLVDVVIKAQTAQEQIEGLEFELKLNGWYLYDPARSVVTKMDTKFGFEFGAERENEGGTVSLKITVKGTGVSNITVEKAGEAKSEPAKPEGEEKPADKPAAKPADEAAPSDDK